MTSVTTPKPAINQLESSTPIVDFRNVSMRFDEHQVLKNITFRVMHGETRINLVPAGVGSTSFFASISTTRGGGATSAGAAGRAAFSTTADLGRERNRPICSTNFCNGNRSFEG